MLGVGWALSTIGTGVVLSKSKGPFTLGDTNQCEAVHMRQRNTVTEAHIQRSTHTVSATLPPVFHSLLSKMDHRRCALLCLVVAYCVKKRKKVEGLSVSHGWNDDLRLLAMPKYL